MRLYNITQLSIFRIYTNYQTSGAIRRLPLHHLIF
nr:MAG TPA: hypothetical protein [Caudoviricetes sp.]